MIKSLFPNISTAKNIDILSQDVGNEKLRVGVFFSGGQASGGHNVIAALFDKLKAINLDSELIGFLGGPKGLLEANTINITREFLLPFRDQGGFDLLCSGRDKIETEPDLKKAVEVVKKLKLDGLVVIGGDDSNTNAAYLAETFIQNDLNCSVVGVPKTIDGDLQNEFVEISFGFDTATKTFASEIGSLARDAKSAGKYTFFVKLMGRSASHVTLECAHRTHPNLAFITEEIQAKGQGLADVVGTIADLIERRSAAGKNYGVILIPEGIIEFLPLESLSKSIEKDPHGNIQVSKVESERFFIAEVEKELKRRNFAGSFNPQPIFLGYEGRSCHPSKFDRDYCTALGTVAALLIANKKTAYMAAVRNLAKPKGEWVFSAIALASLIHFEERKGKQKAVIAKALVDLNGKAFKTFEKERESWKVEDAYLYPHPIQVDDDSRPLLIL